MDRDDDNDNDIDEQFDDYPSVVSDDDAHNTNSNEDDDKGGVTKNLINNEDGEREDHTHWLKMKWNKTMHTFEYMKDDYDETADGSPRIKQWKKVHPWGTTDARVIFNEGRNTMI